MLPYGYAPADIEAVTRTALRARCTRCNSKRLAATCAAKAAERGQGDGMSIRIIDGKVHDAEGRLLWIQGLDGAGWPMTVHDLLLADFASLRTVMDEHGHRVAAEAAEANLGMDIWGTDLRARLAERRATTSTLSAEAPCRWIAEQLAELLDRPMLLDDVFPHRGWLCPDQAEHARARVEGRMEVLYEVVEFFLDRSEPTESSATARAGSAA